MCVCVKWSFSLEILVGFVFLYVIRMCLFDPLQLRDRPTVRVVSNPISEMQDRYRGQSAAREPPAEHFSMMQVR